MVTEKKFAYISTQISTSNWQIAISRQQFERHDQLITVTTRLNFLQVFSLFNTVFIRNVLNWPALRARPQDKHQSFCDLS